MTRLADRNPEGEDPKGLRAEHESGGAAEQQAPKSGAQGEALEARARELLAAEYAREGHLAYALEIKRGNLNRVGMGPSIRAITAALQPNIDHAVGGVNLAAIVIRHTKIGGYPDTHAIAADAFELGHAISTPPVKLDAVREALRELLIAVRFADPPKLFSNVLCHEARVPVEFVQRAEAALATPPLDNTGLDAATVELKHVAALLLWQYRTDATALPYATEMWKALDAALASGDRS